MKGCGVFRFVRGKASRFISVQVIGRGAGFVEEHEINVVSKIINMGKQTPRFNGPITFASFQKIVP